MYLHNENINSIDFSIQPIEQLNELKMLCQQHSIWRNPLLIACEAGVLKLNDFQFLFSQYYLYSKNFSRFLAAVMANCESDYYRSKLAENLWEESGEKELENRHAEIFRKFLVDGLHLDLAKITFEPFTKDYASHYMALCLEQPALESAAVLSLGTEGIVARLYILMKQGLLAAGFTDEQLKFFNLHIACDDAHAATLEELLLSYAKKKNWFERAQRAMLAALNLREKFFSDVYAALLKRRMQPLLERTAYPADAIPLINNDHLVFDVDFTQNLLYHNQDNALNIDFQVQRVPFAAEVLDPRLVMVPPGAQTEAHAHAHETVFLILAGEGEVIIADRALPVTAHSMVYVPRWIKHQTRNTGKADLRFFAITDYGLTGRFPLNSEAIYRNKKENVLNTLQYRMCEIVN